MNQLQIIFIILLCGIAAVTCSPVKILNSEGEDTFALSNYKTFDFYQVDTQGDSVSADYRQNVELLKQAIAKQLLSRGLSQATNNPALLVNLGIVLEEKIQTRHTDFRTDAPRYIGQRRYSWKSQQIEVGRYKVGTVSIHQVDNKENKLLLGGAVQGVVPTKIQKLEKTVNEGVEKLFAQIPVSTRQTQ